MRHVGTLALIASSAAAAGGAAFFARERLSRVRTGTCANPAVHPGSAAEAGRIARIAERLRRVWPEVTGESAPMPKAALEIALAQAFLESGVAESGGGGWWKDKTDAGGGNMVGSGNLGARQCGANDEGGDYYTCVEYGDSHPNPDGTQTFFPAKFRYYKAGTCGGKQRDAGDCAAYEFLRDIVRQWPALAELKSGDVLAYAIRQGPKYRSGDPPNQKVFGRDYKGGNGYYGGFGATMQDRVGGYARAIASHLPAVASALGHGRVYACVPPEVAAGGTHAAVSGTLETVYGALHMAGALPRARAIPGSGGSAIVWYVQPAPSSEDTMKTQDIVALLGTGAPLPAPAPPVQGVGTTAAIAVASAAVAAVVGAEVEHHLKKKEKAKDAAVEQAKAKGHGPRPSPGYVLPKKAHPAPGPAALPALDEDRGSLAPLRPLALPALDQDRGSSTSLTMQAPGVAPASPLALPKSPLAAPIVAPKLPTLDTDRGSISAIQSNRLTREDMRQMFPAYTDAQIDEALQQMQPAEQPESLKFEPATKEEAARHTFHGLSESMREDLARLAILEARDAASQDSREHLTAIAEEVSGEEHVTAEWAAASDAYAIARHPNMEGTATAAVAVTAGGLAAGVALAALLSRAKLQEPAAPPPAALPPPPPVAKPAPAASETPSPTVLAEKNVQRLNDELAHLYAANAPVAAIDAKQQELMRAKEQLAAVKDMKVSGVDRATQEPHPAIDATSTHMSARRMSRLLSADSIGAKAEPDDIDKALATGSDAADVATGLLQAFAAGKKIAERGAAQEDPKCRRLVKAWVEKHPLLARITSPDLRTLAGVDLGAADIETFKERYVDVLLARRAALGEAPADCAVTPEEDRAVLLSLGARRNDFEVFTESLSHWAPDKVLPAAASAFKTAAPAMASMYRGGAGGGAMADLSSFLPQQAERRQAPAPEPVVVQKGIGAGATAAIAAGAAAAAAIVAAVIAKR